MLEIEEECSKTCWIKPSKVSIVLWVTYVNTMLYALCFQLQKPVEPFLVKQLSVNAEDSESVARTYGLLQSFFSVIQTVGSPLVGILMDRVGIRKASAMVFLASALSYVILAGASDMRLLFYSKIPTVLQHAFLVSQAAATSSTLGDESARAQALGRMTTAYTLGATIGPYLGGVLAQGGDLYIGAKFAVMGSLLSAVLSLLFLPNGSHRDDRITRKVILGNVNGGNQNDSGLRQFPTLFQELCRSVHLMLRASLWPLLAVKVIGGVAASIYTTAFPLVLTQQLKFDPSSLGIAMSSSMLSVAAFGAIGMAPLARALGIPRMTRTGVVARAILGWSLAASFSDSWVLDRSTMLLLHRQIFLINMMQSVASHALATGLTTQTTGSVEPDELGSLLGLEHALFSLARIAGPPIGSALLAFGASGFWIVANVCGAIDIMLFALLTFSTSQVALASKRK